MKIYEKSTGDQVPFSYYDYNHLTEYTIIRTIKGEEISSNCIFVNNDFYNNHYKNEFPFDMLIVPSGKMLAHGINKHPSIYQENYYWYGIKAKDKEQFENPNWRKTIELKLFIHYISIIFKHTVQEEILCKVSPSH